MNTDPALARAADRARFTATIIVGTSLLLDVLAALLGGEPDAARAGLVTIIVTCTAVGVVFVLPAACFYFTLMRKRAGMRRKPVTPGQLIVEAVMPLVGTVPAWIMAFALGLRVVGIAAAVATVLVAALLWPTEKRLDLVIRGDAKVLFPVQNAA